LFFIKYYAGSVATARVQVCGTQAARTLQDLAAERCSMPYRAPELFNVESYCMVDERTDIWVNITMPTFFQPIFFFRCNVICI
jgi:serine/threonine kinase 16